MLANVSNMPRRGLDLRTGVYRNEWSSVIHCTHHWDDDSNRDYVTQESHWCLENLAHLHDQTPAPIHGTGQEGREGGAIES